MLSIYRRLDVIIRVLQSREGFGMSDQQIPARSQARRKAVDQPLLRLFIEIDHDIAAKDHLKEMRGTQRLHQVETPELDHFADGRFNAVPSLPPAYSAQEVFPGPIQRKLLESFRLIRAAFRSRQRPGGDVSGQDVNSAAGGKSQFIEKRESDGVRLLTRGACRAPDANLPRETGQDGLPQKFEMYGFPQKGREVGGQRVQQSS